MPEVDEPVGRTDAVEGTDQQMHEFSVADLVWGKVKRHPWWPGQIFDPSCASELALRHHRRDNFLVAYFGDKTFAWCDPSQLKHLPSQFLAMEKQSSSEAFIEAVECALGEVSRRVELGLVCGCVPEEVRSHLETREIENSGIRKGVNLPAMVQDSGLPSFCPDKFLQYIRMLAMSPTSDIDRFDFTVARAQLLAYYRSKGFIGVPDIFFGKGLMEDGYEICPSECVADRLTPVSVAEEKMPALFSKKVHEKSGLKRKCASEESRKSRKLSELMEDSEEGNLESYREMHSQNKLQTMSQVSEVSIKGRKRRLNQGGDQEIRPFLAPVRSFKVGECIRRVASKLTTSPSFKSNGVFQKCKEQNDHEKDSPFSLDDSVQSKEEIHNMDISITHGSPIAELLCDLCITARDPLRISVPSSTVIGFFCGFLRFRAANLTNSVSSPDEFGYDTSEERHISGSVLVEDIKTPEEIRRKRKQILTSVSDKDMKPSEEVKRKRGRPRLSSVGEAKQAGDVQRRRDKPCSSTAGEVRSPEEVPRKRGHPRLGSTEQKKPYTDEVPRKRGRPRLKLSVDHKPGELLEDKQAGSQLGSSVNAIMPEPVKRKRGRPPNSSKVVVKNAEISFDENTRAVTSPEIDLSKMTPAYMNDSYWTDVVICSSPEKKLHAPKEKKLGRKRKQYLIQSPECAEKAAGEAMESQSPTDLIETPKQRQVSSFSPNSSSGLMPERRISYFGDKCIEESNPTAFILNFTDADSLPSESELVRIFSRYGPLKDAETEVQKSLSFAKVVFKRRADAEVAFLNARRFNFFGHCLLSFRLRSFPSVCETSVSARLEENMDQTVVNSTSFSISRNESDGTLKTDCVQKAEVLESDKVPLNPTIDILEVIDRDVDQCAMEDLDAERGEPFIVSLNLDGHPVSNGLGDLDFGDTKECSGHVNASPVDEQGQEVDKRPAGDANFVDVLGQRRDKACYMEVRLEDRSNQSDEIVYRGNDNAISGKEEDLAFKDDFDAAVLGTKRVEACFECCNVESERVTRVQVLQNNCSRKKDPALAVATYGFLSCLANSDEITGSNSSCGTLRGAESDFSREVNDMVVQDEGSIENCLEDDKLVASSTKRLEVEFDGSKAERFEVQGCLDACSVILQDNQVHVSKVEVGNVEVLSEDGATQTPETLRCAVSNKGGDSKTLEKSSREVLKDVNESAAPLSRSEENPGKSSTERLRPVHCRFPDVSGTGSNVTTFASASMVCGSSNDENPSDAFCTDVQGLSDSSALRDESNANLVAEDHTVVEDGIVKCLSINKARVPVNIHSSEFRGNIDTSEANNYSLEIPDVEISVEPAYENYVEKFTTICDVPIDSKMVNVDSSGTGVHESGGSVDPETISVTNECQGNSDINLDNVQVNEHMMGLPDAKMDETDDRTDKENLHWDRELESSTIKSDMPVDSGSVEGNQNVGYTIANSSNTKACVHRMVGDTTCETDNINASDGVIRLLVTGSTSEIDDPARSDLLDHGNDESRKFEKHPDCMMNRTDFHRGTCMMEARDAKTDKIPLNNTREVLAGKSDGNVEQCAMPVLNADETFAPSGCLSVHQISIVGNLDAGEIKGCSISANASFEHEHDQEVEKFSGDVSSKDTRGQQRNDVPHREIGLEDHSNQRDRLCITGNDYVIAGSVEGMTFGDAFDGTIQGSERVVVSLDCGNVESRVTGVKILESNGTGDIEGQAFLAKQLEELQGAEVESLKEASNMVVHDTRIIESFVGNAKLTVSSSTNCFEAVHGDLNIEGTEEAWASSDVCSVVLKDNKEAGLKVEIRSVEFLCNIEDEAAQTPEMSECPVADKLGVPVSEILETPSGVVNREVLNNAEDSSASDMQGVLEAQGTSGTQLHGDGSNADVVIEGCTIIGEGIVDCPNIDKSSVSDNASESKFPGNACALDIYSWVPKIPVAEVPIAPEKHMEGSDMNDDVSINGEMVNSLGTDAHDLSGRPDVETISMVKGCIRISNIKVNDVQVNNEMMGGSDARMDEITNATNTENPYCDKQLEPFTIKANMPMEDAINAGDIVTDSSNMKVDLVSSGGISDGGRGVNFTPDKNPEESVREKDDFHACTRTIGPEVIEMTDDVNLENKYSSTGMSVDFCKHSDTLVKIETSTSSGVAENLDHKPDGLADSVNVETPSDSYDSILAPENLESSVRKSNRAHVNGESGCNLCDKVKDIEDATCVDAPDKIDVAPQCDKCWEDSTFQKGGEDFPLKVVCVGADNLIGTAVPKAHDCGYHLVLGASGHLCHKDDKHGNDVQQESAKVDETASKWDSCDFRTDLAPQTVYSDSNCGPTSMRNERAGVTDADNVNDIDIEHFHGGDLEIPASGTGNADIDDGMTKSDFQGDKIRETSNF